MIKFNKMSIIIADIFADKKIKYLIFKGLDVRKIALGARSREFKSLRPDHSAKLRVNLTTREFRVLDFFRSVR